MTECRLDVLRVTSNAKQSHVDRFELPIQIV